MATGVHHLRGLQQHHQEKQGPLRHDRGGGAEETGKEKRR